MTIARQDELPSIEPLRLDVSCAGSVLSDSIGIEIAGGGFAPLLTEGTALPVEEIVHLSTASDNQEELSLHLMTRPKDEGADVQSLANLRVRSIPPKPRGVAEMMLTLRVEEPKEGSYRQATVLSELQVSAQLEETGVDLPIELLSQGS